MKRTLIALLSTLSLGAPAFAAPDAPPPPPVAPLPPLPPLPPVGGGHAGTSAQLDVKGPVTVRAAVIAAGIEVVAGAAKKVKAQLVDSDGGIRLVEHGDRVEVNLEAKPGWPSVPAGIQGTLRLELPPGSHVELNSQAGDIQVRDVGGNVRIRTAAGDVHVRKAAAVEVMAVSGDVFVENSTGEVRLRTVSGDAKVIQSQGLGSHLELGSTSGDLDWTGGCGAGCRIEVRSTSGDVTLRLTDVPSFDLRYVTHSGDLQDKLKLSPLDAGGERGSTRARIGKGQGMVEVQTFSGDLSLQKK